MENKEFEFIKIISEMFEKSPNQINKLNESDSEIVMFGEKKMLVNVDEFSREDRLMEKNPYKLGWNIAAGSLSDIYATGGEPKFFAHSIAIDESWDEEYLKEFSRGISDVLKISGANLIGGDFGKGKEWRYTAVVLGECRENHVLRSTALEGDSIYITGRIGAGNVEAFFSIYEKNPLTRIFNNYFSIRKEEAKLIKKYGSSCIDTSDGVFNCLNIIATESKVGYKVDSLPFIKFGENLAKILGINKLMMFFGEAGEYELLFTVSKENENLFLDEAKENKLKFYKIGEITEKERILIDKKRTINLENVNFRARDFEDIKEYIKKINDL